MRIVDHHGAKEVIVHTVSITHHKSNADESALMFRCPYCADRILRIQGKIVKIAPGLEPAIDVTTINFCPTCQRSYTFQTIKSNKTATRLTLAARGEYNTLHCIECRVPLLKYDNTHPFVVLLPTNTVHTLPFLFACYRCNHQFDVADITTEDV